MTGSPEAPDILRPSRARSVGLGVASAVMAAISFRLWIEGMENAWVAAAFLAAGSVFFFIHLVPGAYALQLDRDGFQVSEMFTVKRYEWAGVSEFAVRRGILGHNVVFEHIAPETGAPRKVVLNESFGYKPFEMARLLNERRSRAAAGARARSRKVWPSRD